MRHFYFSRCGGMHRYAFAQAASTYPSMASRWSAHEHRRHGHGGGGFGVRRPLRYLAHRLDLDECGLVPAVGIRQSTTEATL